MTTPTNTEADIDLEVSGVSNTYTERWQDFYFFTDHLISESKFDLFRGDELAKVRRALKEPYWSEFVHVIHKEAPERSKHGRILLYLDVSGGEEGGLKIPETVATRKEMTGLDVILHTMEANGLCPKVIQKTFMFRHDCRRFRHFGGKNKNVFQTKIMFKPYLYRDRLEVDNGRFKFIDGYPSREAIGAFMESIPKPDEKQKSPLLFRDLLDRMKNPHIKLICHDSLAYQHTNKIAIKGTYGDFLNSVSSVLDVEWDWYGTTQIGGEAQSTILITPSELLGKSCHFCDSFTSNS